MTRIESRQNGTLRRLARLAREKKFRRATGEMVCEGGKMLFEAVSSGAKIRSVLVRESDGDQAAAPLRELLERASAQGAALFSAEPRLFALASDVETPQDVIFSCESPLPTGALPPVRTAMLLEGVQDPGNLGTIVRTAEAFGLGALILCEGCADPTAPKVLRGTMGSIFRTPPYRLPFEEAAAQLRAQGLPLYAAVLREDSAPVTALSLERCALAVGSEGHGLRPETAAQCDQCVIIPMAGRTESLNAGVAASVFLWEMYRAGGFARRSSDSGSNGAGRPVSGTKGE